MDWFLYDNGPHHERVKLFAKQLAKVKKECNTPVVYFPVNDLIIDEEYMTSEVHTLHDAEINPQVI